VKELFVWVGPVHSGKTTRALLVAERYSRMGHKLLLVRPRQSVRDYERPGRLVTKNGCEFESADVRTAPEIQVVAAVNKPTVLWIDEPMLFDDEPQLYGIVSELRRTTTILVSGLSATSELDVFGTSMAKVIAVADKVFHCRADCHRCGSLGTATRSFFTGDRKDGQIKVGGEEVYQALCPDCWTAATAHKAQPILV
jgi:thymidine kinase